MSCSLRLRLFGRRMSHSWANQIQEGYFDRSTPRTKPDQLEVTFKNRHFLPRTVRTKDSLSNARASGLTCRRIRCRPLACISQRPGCPYRIDWVLKLSLTYTDLCVCEHQCGLSCVIFTIGTLVASAQMIDELAKRAEWQHFQALLMSDWSRKDLSLNSQYSRQANR